MGKTFQALERFKKESKNNAPRRPVEKPEVIHIDLEARHGSHDGGGAVEELRTKQAPAPAGIVHEDAGMVKSPASEPSAFSLQPSVYDFQPSVYDFQPSASALQPSSLPSNAGIDPNLVSLLAPQSYEAEQIKLLKANILYRTAGVIPSPMAVTSVLPGEGKSFIAANLAVSIAQELDRHVLLIDCDLRKPGVHRIFGLGDPPGLSEYLTNGTELADLLVRTKEKCLSILPAGGLPPNPSELLSSKRMENLLIEVSTRYQDRIIILDTPPVAMTAEGNTLAQFVEAVLLVVKHNGTPKDQLKEFVKRMGPEKILGVVLNNVDKYAQSYGRYRKYQERYYGKDEATG